jgi:sterol desaturase/sphingolipid hydroxylase (fatty acid hydroxylase superfamily)/CDGSH-type Zn-finger protein
MSELINIVAENHVYIIFAILLVFGLIEAAFGYFSNSKRSKDDVLVESINTLFLMVITKPVVMFLAFQLMKLIIPAKEKILLNTPFWLGLILFLLVDDFLQYWYHRSSHEYKWLWKHHRPHHAATEMGFLVSYRETIYFYMMMPNVWWLGIATFLGLAIPVAVGIVLKQLIVISSHSLATWDSFFHKRPAFKPILKVLERIFITPAFHHAHHAVSKIDDIGQPNGNFGNMFSIWDQLFGTATFKHAFPTEYGLPNDPKDSWAAHTFYPLVKSDKPGSELSSDYIFEKTTVLEPAVLTLKEGDYLYCTCGYSKTQPFCDGSHHGTKYQPQKFTIRKEREYRLCQCKECGKGPFCDDSHLKISLKK